MPVVKVSPLVTIHKEVSNWSSRDTLIYFSNKLKELTGEHLDIPPIAWQGFMARIKGFKDKLKISNEEYKTFIDRVFSEFFVHQKYVPAFGSIVSEYVFNLLKKCSLKEYNNDEFTKLRDRLFKDNMLFKQL